MIFKIGNLGPINQLEIEIKPLTIICGDNCVGKTYLSYFIFSFFRHLIDMNFSILNLDEIEKFLADGELLANKNKIFQSIAKSFPLIKSSFLTRLPRDFSTNESYFEKLEFDITNLDPIKTDFIIKDTNSSLEFFEEKANEKTSLSIVNMEKDKILIKLNRLGFGIKIPPRIIGRFIDSTLLTHLNITKFALPITSERTGVSLFYKDLDLNRNSLFEMLQKNEKIDRELLISTLGKSSKYPLPINFNIDMIRNASDNSKSKSIFNNNSNDDDILFINTWNAFIGGDFNILERDILFEFSKKRKKIKLPLHISASSLKSLLPFDIYIKHMANQNSMLFLDEPEMNLSPLNQILLTRFIVHIMNKGIPIFLTTHSDYILREINNMIMINNLSNEKRKLIQDSNPLNSFFPSLDPEKVNIQQLTRNKSKVVINEIKATKDGIEKNIFDTIIQYQSKVMKDLLFN